MDETFDDYVSVDRFVVTSGVNTAKELCESHVGTWSVEGEEEKGEDSKPEPEVVPNFAEALMKVKLFIYTHTHTHICKAVLVEQN
jgi:hypothetical protein